MIPIFDKNSHVNRMVIPVTKLVAQLNKIGIEFSATNYIVDAKDNLHNVVFTKGDKIVNMSHHSFYRYSGIMQITRTKLDSNGKETNWTEVFPVTDDMYMQLFIKPIIIKAFELK